MRITPFFLAALLSAGLIAEQKEEIAKISEAFGHLIGKNIDTLGVDFDIEHVVKGLQDAAKGKNSPLTENECIEAIAQAQEKAYQKKAEENLQAAESFLKNNAKESNVVVVDEGKLQYKVEKKGNGQAVSEASHPIIRYVGKYLDGTVFGQSSEDEVVSLDESIQGFRKGLVGMKEGEKRTLFIHPEYGYGTQGYLPPNSLLSFEIEVVKADAPIQDKSESLILDPSDDKTTLDLDSPALR